MALKPRNLLLVGFDLAALARSARAAGYEVLAADYFGDLDLAEACARYEAVVKQAPGRSCGRIKDRYDPEVFLKLARKLSEEAPVDGVLLSSGLDDFPNVLEGLEDVAPILGNSPGAFARVRDKAKFFAELKRLGLPHPETSVAEGFKEAKKAAKDIGYPVVLKPLSGFAGAGVRKAEGTSELKVGFKAAASPGGKVVVQEYIRGTHASISFLSSGNEAKVLAASKQLLGLKELGQPEPFGFCGSVLPFNLAESERREEIAEKLTSRFGLKGSNGVDVVVSDGGDLYIIEVNPRFQATLECLERVLNLNLVRLHVKACLSGFLPKAPSETGKYCARVILFAKGRARVSDLRALSWARDIPIPGVIVEEGEPLCSIVAEGRTGGEALRRGMEAARFVYRNLTAPV